MWITKNKNKTLDQKESIFFKFISSIWKIKLQSANTNPKQSDLFGIPQVLPWNFWLSAHFYLKKWPEMFKIRPVFNKGRTKWTKMYKFQKFAQEALFVRPKFAIFDTFSPFQCLLNPMSIKFLFEWTKTDH